MRRTILRRIVLTFSLTILSCLAWIFCDLKPSPDSQQFTDYHPMESYKTKPAIFSRDALVYESEIAQLKQEIATLQSKLKTALISNVVSENPPAAEEKLREKAIFLENHFKHILAESEIKNGIAWNNEYEVFPFIRFTLDRIYLVDPGLGKRVIEKPIGLKKKDLHEVINYAIDQLNTKLQQQQQQQQQLHGNVIYDQKDFIEGIYRNEPTRGSLYELYFEDVTNRSQYQKLVFYRPYGPVYQILMQQKQTGRQRINIVVPLKGRVDKFQSFISRYQVLLQKDRNLHLTVVYFGQDGLADVRRSLSTLDSTSYNLVTLTGNFSRGRALQEGANCWSPTEYGSDCLLFFCDVDIILSVDSLERCRLNTSPGKRVYYPIVFSLYNPEVVYQLHNAAVPSLEEQLVVSKDTGFWRDFGYGMTCQYYSDFRTIGGFDESFFGWGEEDVYLYKKYLKSEYFVIRATDPGIFHLWHEKWCDPALSNDQYHGCIRSKALNEASHSQLGILAFKDEINIRRSIKQKKAKSPN